MQNDKKSTLEELESDFQTLALKIGHLPPVVMQSAMHSMARINKLIQELKKENKGE
jgi:hypothetical protein